jgi:hypothetical protein
MAAVGQGDTRVTEKTKIHAERKKETTFFFSSYFPPFFFYYLTNGRTFIRSAPSVTCLLSLSTPPVSRRAHDAIVGDQINRLKRTSFFSFLLFWLHSLTRIRKNLFFLPSIPFHWFNEIFWERD